MNRRRLTVATALAVLATAAAAAPSAAASGIEVENQGSCTAASDWKLKAKTDDGRIEVEFEVDSNRAGQTWQVRLTDNGVQVFAGRRVTTAPSGSFSLERRIPNRPGPDVIRARAVHRPTGEVCTGTVTVRA